MEFACKQGALVLPLIGLGLFLAVGTVFAEEFIYATCVMEPLGFPGMNISGKIELKESLSANIVVLTGHLYGFANGSEGGKRGFHVHEFGKTANNCTAAGLHYNPFNKTHGGPTDIVRHVGDLGNIEVEGNLESHFTISDTIVSLHGNYSIINRALVVHVGEDDLGKGGFNDSLTTGHSGYRIGCCVITSEPSVKTTAKPGPAGTATSMEPFRFLLLFLAGLLPLLKCIQL